MIQAKERLTGSRLRVLTLGAVLFAAFSLAAPLSAQEDLEKPPPLPPPQPAGQEGDVPIPPKIQDELVEPTVTIREEDDRRIEEYRMNGQVYMVKVTPRGGVPYYYICLLYTSDAADDSVLV